MLPPTVAIFLICCAAPAFSASDNSGCSFSTISFSATSLFSASAPIWSLPLFFSIFLSGSLLMSTSFCGEATPFFIRSTRLVPPAMNCAVVSFTKASTAFLEVEARMYWKLIIICALLFLHQPLLLQYWDKRRNGKCCHSYIHGSRHRCWHVPRGCTRCPIGSGRACNNRIETRRV